VNHKTTNGTLTRFRRRAAQRGLPIASTFDFYLGQGRDAPSTFNDAL
jgi:hypothetical protein